MLGNGFALSQSSLLSLSSLALAMPVECCTHSKFPFWLHYQSTEILVGNGASPIPPGFALAIFAHPPTSSLNFNFNFILLLSTKNVSYCRS